MPNRSQTKPSLPVIRLILVSPVVEELERRRFDIRPVLEKFSVTRENVFDPDFWVPAAKMYGLFEEFADYTHDPYFGVRQGELLNPWGWSPTARAAQESSSVVEFLLRFMADSQEDVNSCDYSLTTSGKRTTLHERRRSDGGVLPRHNDGYTVTYLLSILRGAVGTSWKGKNVLAQVCDPGVIPPGYMGIRTAETDTLGARISFPAHWLLLPFGSSAKPASAMPERVSRTPLSNFVDAFLFAISSHIHESGLDTDRAAELCGMSKRTLARKLSNRGTTCYQEICRLRRQRAEQQLTETKLSIGRIAASVGYSDPVVFSRAFKRWTGKSPREFRASQNTT
jgi:AraC-like DNA-binding protein